MFLLTQFPVTCELDILSRIPDLTGCIGPVVSLNPDSGREHMTDTVIGILGLARKAGKCHLKENPNVPDLSVQPIGRALGISRLEDCNLLLPTRKKKKYCGRRRNSFFSCFTMAQIYKVPVVSNVCWRKCNGNRHFPLCPYFCRSHGSKAWTCQFPQKPNLQALFLP